MKLVRIVPALIGATMLLTGTAHAQAVAKTTTMRHYDCSKAGNANKAACKNAAVATTTTTVATPATAPKASTMQSAAVRSRATTTSTTKTIKDGDKATHPGGPNGATAQCKDGTYSKSTHHSGTCAGHKGVATWY